MTDMLVESIRQKLRHPPNAVPDKPICLKRPTGITGYEAQKIANATRAENKIAALQSALRAMIEKYERPKKGLSPTQRKPLLSFNDFPSIREIQDAVCVASKTRRLHLLSHRRHRTVVIPRQVAMLLCKTLTPYSLPQIGIQFDRDHTTVLHAVRKFEPILCDLEDAIEFAPLNYLADVMLRAAWRVRCGKASRFVAPRVF